MQEEAPQKLRGGQRHYFLLAAVSVVFPAEADLLVLACQEPMVRDRHPVRIAPQIAKNRERSAERRFGINHPAPQTYAAQEPGKLSVISEHTAGASLTELAHPPQSLQAGEKLAPEDLAQGSNRQEEVGFP